MARKSWHEPQIADLPPYLIDVDTLARWLIIQCGSVRQARKIVSENAEVLHRRHRPPVPPFVVCLLAEKIRRTKPRKRGGPMSMYTAIRHAARELLKDKHDIGAATQAAWRMVKRGEWQQLTRLLTK